MISTTLAVSWRRLVRFALALALVVLAMPPAAAQDRDEAAAVRIEKVDLRDLPLSDACRLLSDQTGLNLVPSASAAQQKVSLYLRNVDALAAVEALCKSQQLWFQRDPVTGFVRIHTVQEYRLDLSDVQEAQTEYFTLLYPNALDVGYAIRNLYGNRVALRIGSGEADDIQDLEDRLDRLDVIDEGARGLGSRLLGTQNGIGSTGSTGEGASAGRGGSRGDRDTSGDRSGGAATQDERVAARAAGDMRIGARGEVTAEEILNLERQLAGSDPDGSRRAALISSLAQLRQAPIFVTVARRQNKVIVRTGDARALEQIRTLVGRMDIPTPMVLLEVRVLSVELDEGMSSFFEYQWANGNFAGAFAQGVIANPTPPALGPAGTGLRAGDLTFQFVDAHFAARMQLLEHDARVRTLATPLLLTANNEASRLFVGREVPLNRSFNGGQVINTDQAVTTVPGTTAIEFRPVGTTLLITPNINSDRTVTLRIVQESSDVNSTEEVLVPSGTGFAQQTVNVVSSQSVSGTIVAKSDLAVAFGGLIEKSSVVDEQKVPILGDIPILGFPFKRSVNRQTRREIVVVVRPFVLSTPAEAEAYSHRLLGGRMPEANVIVPIDEAGPATGERKRELDGRK